MHGSNTSQFTVTNVSDIKTGNYQPIINSQISVAGIHYNYQHTYYPKYLGLLNHNRTNGQHKITHKCCLFVLNVITTYIRFTKRQVKGICPVRHNLHKTSSSCEPPTTVEYMLPKFCMIILFEEETCTNDKMRTDEIERTT